MLGLILIIVLLLLLIGGLPHWPYWHGVGGPYGWYPSSALGVVVIILIVLLLLGRI